MKGLGARIGEPIELVVRELVFTEGKSREAYVYYVGFIHSVSEEQVCLSSDTNQTHLTWIDGKDINYVNVLNRETGNWRDIVW